MRGSHWHQAAVACAVAFAGFSAVHLIDDFVFGIPSEFHLSFSVALLLALAYMIALVGLVASASRNSPAALLGLTVAGILIALAQLLKTLPEILEPGPWHSGAASELAAAGLGLSAALTALAACQARRAARREEVP